MIFQIGKYKYGCAIAGPGICILEIEDESGIKIHLACDEATAQGIAKALLEPQIPTYQGGGVLLG